MAFNKNKVIKSLITIEAQRKKLFNKITFTTQYIRLFLLRTEYFSHDSKINGI